MSPALRQRAEEYVAMRRALGFKLDNFARLLVDYISYLEDEDVPTVTVDSVLTWAALPLHASPAYVYMRFGVARAFAAHLHTLDPEAEIPPAGLVVRHCRRAAPYLYSEDDIALLLETARTITSPFRAATYQTLIGLLAVTGMRIGEAIALDRADLNTNRQVLTVVNSKFTKSREVPLHPTSVDALKVYLQRIDRPRAAVSAPGLFVSMKGTRLRRNIVDVTFAGLARRAGLGARSENCRPRVHDLRHSFAIRTLLDWYRHGLDVQVRLPLLSTFLGHIDPASTYWYLTATPELLALAAERLERPLGGLR